MPHQYDPELVRENYQGRLNTKREEIKRKDREIKKNSDKNNWTYTQKKRKT